MLKVLMRSKLLSIVAWFTGATRKRKSTSKGTAVAFATLMLYALGSIGFLFFGMFVSIAEPFSKAGLGWLYFALAIVMSFGMMFIGSVFTSKSQLFEAKDNDLLLSLPVKSSDILLSRLFLLAVIDLIMGLVVMVPAGFVWGKAAGFSAAGLLSFILGLFLIMLVALSVASLFGWILSIITARLPKNQTIATVLLSLIFLGLYMYFIGNMNQMFLQLADNPEPAGRVLGSIAPVVWLSRAIAEGDLFRLLLSLILPAVLFTLMYVLLSRTFVRTVTTKISRKKEVYRGNTAQLQATGKALLQREWVRFTTCPTYVLNGAFGNIVAVIGAVVLLVKKDALTALSQQSGLQMLLPGLFLFAACAVGTMTMLTAPSVSLEGKNLWISRSLPVSTQDLLRAKLRLHCLIGMPSLLPLLIVSLILLRPAPTEAAFLILLPLAMVAFSAVVGLWAGIRHPNLDWTTEAQAVKSGMGVLIDMAVTMGSIIPPLVIFFVFGSLIPLSVIAGAFFLFILLLTLVLYRWIMRRGAELFEDL